MPRFSQTLNEINRNLVVQISQFQPQTKKEKDLHLQVFRVIGSLDSLDSKFYQIYSNTGFNANWLKSINYFKKNRQAEWTDLEISLGKWLNLYPTTARPEVCKFLNLTADLNDSTRYRIILGDGNDYPNGAFPLLLGELKSRFLIESMRHLKQNLNAGLMVNQITSDNKQLLQALKKNYFVGEKIKFQVYSGNRRTPKVTVNNEPLSGTQNGFYFDFEFVPNQPGDYQLLGSNNIENISYQFSAIKPKLRFLENEENIAAFVGIPLELHLDLSEFSNPDDFKIQSDHAEIVNFGNKVKVTPREEGKVELKLVYNGIVSDQRYIVAIRPPMVAVKLRDISGDYVTISDAHCLEADNAAWQVLNFEMTAYQPNRNSITVNSYTRFFRNEMHKLYSKSPSGTTFVFKNINLINMDGKTESQGTPFFFVKS
jgi:hypothetical protein